jgi:uncharacterized protein (TIGR04222 family)
MNEPWGISGPVFAWSYAGLIVVPTLAGMLVSRVLRQGWGATASARLPGIYHFAYLAAGPERVTETVVASLIEREQLRVSSSGTLRTTPLQPVDPLELEAMKLVASRFATTAYSLGAPMRSSAPMAALRTELAERGWILPDARRRAVWRTVTWVYFAVLALGVARAVNGAADRPIGILVLLMCVVPAGVVFAYRQSLPGKNETTKAGQAVLQRANGDRSLAAGPVRAVAKGGIHRYTDHALAQALMKPYPKRRHSWAAGSTGYAGAGFIGASSCSGGCGSSCGGDGGGGGCGG